jgi:DNA-binding MarR family transcriptional regulator
MEPVMDKEQKGDQEIKQLGEIDPLIHSPARLKVMTYLYVVEKIDFVYLQRVTALTWGNLSKHVTKLEEAGYLETEKTFENKKPKTTLWLTGQGREAFQKYKDNLQEIFDQLDD